MIPVTDLLRGPYAAFVLTMAFVAATHGFALAVQITCSVGLFWLGTDFARYLLENRDER